MPNCFFLMKNANKVHNHLPTNTETRTQLALQKQMSIDNQFFILEVFSEENLLIRVKINKRDSRMEFYKNITLIYIF